MCAGARNAPLVVALEEWESISLRYFFDERSAAFFALGRTKESHQPVAVVTTSGTAVAELYPAVIESYYSRLPLVLVTADRPPPYRYSGAPQSMNQIGVFAHYAPTFDWDSPFSLKSSLKSIKGPTHINISFAEPLMGEGREIEERKKLPWRNFQSPLVILGGVPEKYRFHLLSQLKKMERPIYAEAFSGLRENYELRHLVIQSGEESIGVAFHGGEFDSVLRIGSVPTLRFWRDLDTVQLNIPVHSVSHLPFSGLASLSLEPQSFESFFEEKDIHFQGGKEWLKWDRKKSREVEKLYSLFPNSEPSMVNLLSHQIAPNEMVFLGNSLPIREWDLCSSFVIPHENVKANRGMNGIDGLVSSFLGSMNSERRNWCLLGDLSALYDLSALWLKGREELKPFNIVVINNKGGRIFSRIFGRAIFENHHDLHFQHWAELFGLEYHLFQTGLDVSRVQTTSAIIELQPDNKQSEEFWKAYSQIFVR